MGWLRSMKPVRASATYSAALELDQIIVFGDLVGKVECFISSHGTDNWATATAATQTFVVPAGIGVRFYCYQGYTYVPDDIGAQFRRMANTGARSLATQHLPGANRADLSYNGGTACPNYWLSKSQGRHVADAESASAVDGTFESYESLQLATKRFNRVVVTIRNRRDKGITLSDLIETLQSCQATRLITTFHCSFCRGDRTANYL